MLVIDCCIRGDASATRRYYKAYLDRFRKNADIETVELSCLDIQSFTVETLERRDLLAGAGQFDNEMFALARQFRDADEILIAAPFWDLSFPSLLKVYLEHICVSGLTFGYEETGCVGYCRAERLLYFSTCGGFAGDRHLGFEYIKSLAGMLGITECTAFTAEGLDIDPEKREAVLAGAIRALYYTNPNGSL